MPVQTDIFSLPRHGGIEHSAATPPVPIPAGHVGPFVIPGTGRTVWWTGRVAIGLRHQPERFDAVTSSSLWLQQLMLDGPRQRRGDRPMRPSAAG